MVEIFDNIRKLYRFSDPSPALAPYIEFFSESSVEAMQQHIDAANFTVKLFPSYTPTIWINLGSPYLLKNGAQYQKISHNEDILVLRNEIIERNNLPTDNIFTVKFNPGGFEAIFGISQTKIGSQIIPLQQIISASIIHQLKRLEGLEERRNLLERFFLDTITKQRQAQQHYLLRVQQALNQFQEGTTTIQELTKQLCITEKTLYRYFLHVVGASPKHYFGTVRARQALTVYAANPAAFSPYDFGYYDRSHFYKEVIKFTGQKLSAQLK